MNYNQAQVYGGNREANFHYLGNQTLQYGEQFQLELSCPFNFTKFPFDSNECFIEYVTFEHLLVDIKLKPLTIVYRNTSHKFGAPPIILQQPQHPYSIELKSLPASTKEYSTIGVFSSTGMAIKFKRNNLGQLFTAYYFPTGSFALISTISFLIKPDLVSSIYFFTASCPRNSINEEDTVHT